MYPPYPPPEVTKYLKIMVFGPDVEFWSGGNGRNVVVVKRTHNDVPAA